MNSNKYVISIDQGSTSTRAVIYDKNLNIVSSSQIKLEEIYPQDGWVELNPEQITKSVIKSTKNALNNSNINTNDVLSIGITNQRETVVFWDKNTLKPIGNAISWQCLRGIKICEEMKGSNFEDTFNSSTGLKIDPYFSFSKIKWALDNNKEISASIKNKTLQIGTVDSWILANLTENRESKIDSLKKWMVESSSANTINSSPFSILVDELTINFLSPLKIKRILAK